MTVKQLYKALGQESFDLTHTNVVFIDCEGKARDIEDVIIEDLDGSVAVKLLEFARLPDEM